MARYDKETGMTSFSGKDFETWHHSQKARTETDRKARRRPIPQVDERDFDAGSEEPSPLEGSGTNNVDTTTANRELVAGWSIAPDGVLLYRGKPPQMRVNHHERRRKSKRLW